MLKINRTYLAIHLLIMSIPMLWSQEQAEYREIKVLGEEEIKFFFRLDSHIFEKDFGGNEQELSRLDSIMRNEYTLVDLRSLEIMATASIDGREKNNALLSERRAATMKRILTQRYPQINKDLLSTSFVPENWDDLRADIVANQKVPYRDEVLKIIDSDREADAKEWLIKTMHRGNVWEYLKSHILPRQRYGASMNIFYKFEQQEIAQDMVDTIRLEPYHIQDTVVLRDSVYLLEKKYTPIAIKTNLLYDVVGAINLEVEIPIGKRWSVGAEVIYPWWYGNKANLTERIRQGHLSVTYWLGDREKWDYLTGWNIGVFGGYGDYDMQIFNGEGVQGDLTNTGVNFGYAHNINKKGNLHLHYQLGFGYARSDYREYTKYWDTKYGDVKVFDYPWEVKRKTWIGPTQAEISLVWMINLGRNKSLLGRKKAER